MMSRPADDDDEEEININIVIEEECQERRESEIEFITSAYDSEEAWVVFDVDDDGNEDDSDGNDNDDDDDDSNTNNGHRRRRPLTRIHRRLDLIINNNNNNSNDGSNSSSSTAITIELILTMEYNYPIESTLKIKLSKLIICDDVVDDVDVGSGKSKTSSNCNIKSTRCYGDALDLLVNSCRSVAEENIGQESVFVVLNHADEWIVEEWPKFIEQKQHQQKQHQQQQQKLLVATTATTTAAAATAAVVVEKETSTSSTTAPSSSAEEEQGDKKSSSKNNIFSLYIIRSHHILDHPPDNILGKGLKYKLNGYYRYGTPGFAICLVNNNNENDDDEDKDNVENFLNILQKKMPQKKFELIILDNSREIPISSKMTGGGFWKDVTANPEEELLKSMILTEDEYYDILKLNNKKGSGNGGSGYSKKKKKKGK